MRKELTQEKTVVMATHREKSLVAPLAVQAQVQVLASVRDRALAGLSN